MDDYELSPPTRRQMEVLRFVYDYLLKYGYQPTLREIAKKLGIANHNGVFGHLSALERRGYLAMTEGQRAILLMKWPDGGEFRGLARIP